MRIKATTAASKNIMVERINKEIQKDRFSATEYAIYAVRCMEDKEVKKNKRGKHRLSQFIMKN